MTASYKPLPPLERLQELFDYNPETGHLIRRVDRGPARAGSIAGCLAQHLAQHGYLFVRIDYELYTCHRIAWRMHYGEDPLEKEIDHIDGNRQNNKIANLRLADKSQNMSNKTARVDNTSGHLGVSYSRHTRKWVTELVKNGKKVYREHFASLEDAVTARRRAELDFHEDFAAHLGANAGQPQGKR